MFYGVLPRVALSFFILSIQVCVSFVNATSVSQLNRDAKSIGMLENKFGTTLLPQDLDSLQENSKRYVESLQHTVATSSVEVQARESVQNCLSKLSQFSITVNQQTIYSFQAPIAQMTCKLFAATEQYEKYLEQREKKIKNLLQNAKDEFLGLHEAIRISVQDYGYQQHGDLPTVHAITQMFSILEKLGVNGMLQLKKMAMAVSAEAGDDVEVNEDEEEKPKGRSYIKWGIGILGTVLVAWLGKKMLWDPWRQARGILKELEGCPKDQVLERLVEIVAAKPESEQVQLLSLAQKFIPKFDVNDGDGLKKVFHALAGVSPAQQPSLIRSFYTAFGKKIDKDAFEGIQVGEKITRIDGRDIPMDQLLEKVKESDSLRRSWFGRVWKGATGLRDRFVTGTPKLSGNEIVVGQDVGSSDEKKLADEQSPQDQDCSKEKEKVSLVRSVLGRVFNGCDHGDKQEVYTPVLPKIIGDGNKVLSGRVLAAVDSVQEKESNQAVVVEQPKIEEEVSEVQQLPDTVFDVAIEEEVAEQLLQEEQVPSWTSWSGEQVSRAGGWVTSWWGSREK